MMRRKSSVRDARARTGLTDALKIVLPSVILTALGFAALRRVNHNIQPALLAFMASAAMGMAAGFTTRWSLGSRSEWLRHIVALSAVVIGLIVLGMVTQGEAGLV